MKTTSRPRLAVLVFAALALPALTCGVAPALRDLTLRMQRVESYLATVNLPPLLADAHGNVVGPVLDYNRLFMFASVDSRDASVFGGAPIGSSAPVSGHELATVLYTPPGGRPVVLDAHAEELVTTDHGWGLSLYFETSDCSGTAWVPSGWVSGTYLGSNVYARAWIATPGRTLYVEDLQTPPEQSIDIVSRRIVVGWNAGFEQQGTEGPCELVNAPIDTLWRPLQPVADLDALFTPPFRLVAQTGLTP